MTTDEDVKKAIGYLLDPLWSFEKVKQWYGIDVDAAPQNFLAQYRIWVERYRDADPSAINVDRQLNRFYLELFLQHRGLTGPRAAAVSLGMSEKSFFRLLEIGKQKDYFSEGEANGDFPVARVFRSSFVNDIFKRFGNLADFTFTTYSGFCARLHKAIESELKITVEPLFCLTSQKLDGATQEFANDFDAITEEPIGLPFQVWIETKKPIQLKPDACSWLTCARHEEVLKPYTNIENDAEFQKVKAKLIS